jgi:hypothetical protein
LATAAPAPRPKKCPLVSPRNVLTEGFADYYGASRADLTVKMRFFLGIVL